MRKGLTHRLIINEPALRLLQEFFCKNARKIHHYKVEVCVKTLLMCAPFAQIWVQTDNDNGPLLTENEPNFFSCQNGTHLYFFRFEPSKYSFLRQALKSVHTVFPLVNVSNLRGVTDSVAFNMRRQFNGSGEATDIRKTGVATSSLGGAAFWFSAFDFDFTYFPRNLVSYQGGDILTTIDIVMLEKFIVRPKLAWCVCYF